jgi:hypothetical protein
LNQKSELMERVKQSTYTLHNNYFQRDYSFLVFFNNSLASNSTFISVVFVFVLAKQKKFKTSIIVLVVKLVNTILDIWGFLFITVN